MNAFYRNPLGVVGIAWQVYGDYWSAAAMRISRTDFCSNNPRGRFHCLLAGRFILRCRRGPNQQRLQRYYVLAWPYYFVLLLAPSCRPRRHFSSTRSMPRLFIIYRCLSPFGHICGHSVRFFQPVLLERFGDRSVGHKNLCHLEQDASSKRTRFMKNPITMAEELGRSREFQNWTLVAFLSC